MPQFLERITAFELAERIADRVKAAEDRKARYAFFLGAGCSKTCGIPTAGTLVNQWLSELHDFKGGGHSFEEWRTKVFPSFRGDEPALAYKDVIAKRFPFDGDRQDAIERLCEGRFPSFGYVTLARLI